MDCYQHKLTDTEIFCQTFSQKVTAQRIPVSGSIELTHRCTFNCVHCYLGEKTQTTTESTNELGTGKWLRIIDEIVEAGCLFLLFTGGEPMLHKDFVKIYRHARKSGLLVTVFTNGYYIPDDVLKTFMEYPPNIIEITLYGATPETYKRITRRVDGFEKCLKNIKKLINNAMQTKLKTVVLRDNLQEFDAIVQIAKDLDVKFRFDPFVSFCLDGDPGPKVHRISAREAAKKQLATEKQKNAWLDFADRMTGATLDKTM